MKTKSLEKTNAEPARSTGTRHARSAARKSTSRDWNWMDSDAEQDAQALIRLSHFLDERGLRTHASSVDSAIAALTALQDEVDRLSKASGNK